MKYFVVFDGETYHLLNADRFDVDERGYLRFFVGDDEVGIFNHNRWVRVNEKTNLQRKESNG